MNEMTREHTSPLAGIDTSFARYIEARSLKDAQHRIDGIPDYAFTMDYEMKKRLTAIPHYEKISKYITSTAVTREIQAMNRYALAVGPDQFPEIYKMTVDCARRLGIGIPNVFVLNNVGIQAYTIAADDSSPIVVLFSGLVERFTPGELKFIIGHECGHIHNNHEVYQTVVRAFFNGFAGGLAGLVTLAGRAMMATWSRACEVTADRAGMICADSVDDCISAIAKFLYGATLNNEVHVNLEALERQLNETISNPSRVLELTKEHPSTVRRVFMLKAFAECETLLDWRPEFKRPDTEVKTKEQTDQRCRKLVAVTRDMEGGA